MKVTFVNNQQYSSSAIYPPSHSISGLACIAHLVKLQGHTTPSFPQVDERELQQASALQKVAKQMGLESHMMLIAKDHLEELAEINAPILIPLLSERLNQVEWAILWSKRGNLFEVLDPQLGRRWLSTAQLNELMHQASMTISSQTWTQLVQSELFLKGTARLLQSLHLSVEHIQDLTESYPSPEQMRVLDAAIRFVAQLTREQGGIFKGEESYRMLKSLCDRFLAQPSDHLLPTRYFSVIPHRESQDWLWSGYCVLVVDDFAAVAPSGSVNWQQIIATLNPFPPQIRSYLTNQRLFLSLTFSALLLGALGTFLQVILLRGVLLVVAQVGNFEQRLQIILGIALFFIMLGLLRLMTNFALVRLGHQLDGRLRTTILNLLPTLRDDIFQHIPIGDLAERTSSLRAVRHLPYYFGESVQLLTQIVLTAIGLIWLDWVVALLAIVRVAISFSLIGLVNILNLPNKITRQNLGLLGQFHLDTLISLVPIRSHVAEASTTQQHNHLLGRWLKGRWTEHRIEIVIEWVITINSFLLVALIMWVYSLRTTTSNYWLLVLYWSISLDVLGTQLMNIIFLARRERSKVERFMQLVDDANQSAPSATTSTVPIDWQSQGVNIQLRDLTVHLESQTLLRSINLDLEAGEHVAVVGLSGAGKSTLANLMLGLYTHFDGFFVVNGQPVTPQLFDTLRQHTVWVSPNVKLWNRTLLENLQYGAAKPFRSLEETLTKSSLNTLIERLPEGMQTILFEDGKRVSGGERQKIQFGRALQREDVRLVILDEPFSELNHQQHREMLEHSRATWRDATLLYITHDLELSTTFKRVLVVHDGQIAEDGVPQDLLDEPTLYARMHASAKSWQEAKQQMGNPRYIRLQDGVLKEGVP